MLGCLASPATIDEPGRGGDLLADCSLREGRGVHSVISPPVCLSENDIHQPVGSSRVVLFLNRQKSTLCLQEPPSKGIIVPVVVV